MIGRVNIKKKSDPCYCCACVWSMVIFALH